MELHLSNLVPDQILKALFNTLIYSLWQGLILAGVTGLIIVLTRKANAALRYNLLLCLLVSFTAGITLTFFTQLHIAAAPINVTFQDRFVQATPTLVFVTAGPESVIRNWFGFFNAHSETILLIWFLIICARFVQLAAGLKTIYRIKHNRVLCAGKFWDNKIDELSHRMGIKHAVQLMQSGIAKLPLVLGHFKPVILIPVGVLTALSTEEVEAIFMHELAHIKRNDYLVNLLQNLLEIAFFFNPAVLWLSSLIKGERENCCDDIALSYIGGSKARYIQALVSFYEYPGKIPSHAMGLNGSNLLQRVQRIVDNRNKSLNTIEKVVLSICVISAILLTAGFSKVKASKNSFISNAAINAPSTKDVSNPPSLSNFVRVGTTNTASVRNLIKMKKTALGTISNERVGVPRTDVMEETSADTVPKGDQIVQKALAKIVVHSAPPAPLKYKLLYSKIAEEFLKENLIKDKNNFSYQMTASRLIIDGVEQEEELHLRILEKFIKEPDNDLNLVYNYNFHY